MFTYCLVTKGRREYLPYTLASLAEALQSPDVQVIVIDNGCTDDVTNLLAKWCQENGERAHFERFDINDTAPSRVWNLLRKFDVEWLVFPGDDDVVEPKFLHVARAQIAKQPDLRAIASGMRIIDSSGKPSGNIRTPREFTGSQIEYLASSLYEPPFLFPGLFINFKKFNVALPHSRYIFDWWLSLNLISLGPIFTTPEVSIDYRVHPDQESSLAPNRRKFFEAQVVLSRFMSDDVFTSLVNTLSDTERMKLWELISAKGPIYGDLEFGKSLSLKIAILIADSMNDPAGSAQILGDLAAMNEAYLRCGETNTLLSSKYSSLDHYSGNFRLKVSEGTCMEIMDYANSLPINNNMSFTFQVGCEHSISSASYIIDCDLFRISSQAALDILVLQITEFREKSGELEFKLTPIERKIVLLIRNWKKRLPTHFIRSIRKGVEQ
jgi:glycosyltransferase involved in cell wall biosynthesis